jgi:hypothetical protein
MQTRTHDVVLESLRHDRVERLARRNVLASWIREAMEGFGDDEQPRTNLPSPGLRSDEWRYWDRSRKRYEYPSKQQLISKADYQLLCQFGTLPQLEAAWAAIEPCLPRLDSAPEAPVVESVAPVRPKRNVELHVDRVRRAMIAMLLQHRNADVTDCTAVASELGLGANTVSGWFTGSGKTFKERLRELAPEVIAEADRDRAAGRQAEEK